MSEGSSTRETSMQNDNIEENREEQDVERGGYRLELPQDGYEWREYGQKPIRNIGKFRSYFRCQRANCGAKKRVDWSNSEPGNLRVVYEGSHNHGPSSTLHQTGSSQQGSSSSTANQYDLYTQVFGDQPAPNRHGQNTS